MIFRATLLATVGILVAGRQEYISNGQIEKYTIKTNRQKLEQPKLSNNGKREIGIAIPNKYFDAEPRMFESVQEWFDENIASMFGSDQDKLIVKYEEQSPAGTFDPLMSSMIGDNRNFLTQLDEAHPYLFEYRTPFEMMESAKKQLMEMAMPTSVKEKIQTVTKTIYELPITTTTENPMPRPRPLLPYRLPYPYYLYPPFFPSSTTTTSTTTTPSTTPTTTPTSIRTNEKDGMMFIMMTMDDSTTNDGTINTKADIITRIRDRLSSEFGIDSPKVFIVEQDQTITTT